MKVLIVEPDGRFAEATRRYLEAHANLVVRDHPSVALTRARHWEPDLVVLAGEVAEGGLLEQVQALPNRPAVLLTEHMDRYDRAWRLWQQGGDELLMKPIFSAGELNEGIVAALENRSTESRQVAASA